MASVLEARLLTAEAFRRFGQVLPLAPRDGGQVINGGTAQRHDLPLEAELDANGGRPGLSIFRAQPASLPLRIVRLERHPLSTQMFVPLDGRPYLVVVAEASGSEGRIATTDVQAFVAHGAQAINYARDVWHHPLISLVALSRFLVLGREGKGTNCELADVAGELQLALPQASKSS